MTVNSETVVAVNWSLTKRHWAFPEIQRGLSGWSQSMKARCGQASPVFDPANVASPAHIVKFGETGEVLPPCKKCQKIKEFD